MFSRALWVAFLTLALSSHMAQGAPSLQQQSEQDCNTVSVQTVFHTVTVTAGGATETHASSSSKGKTGSSGTTTTHTSARTTHTSTKGDTGSHSSGSKGNTGHHGSGTSTTVKGTSTKSSTSSTATSTNHVTTVNSDGDAQTSLTLDPNVIATGFESNGQETPEPGQVASLTSSNNFINFCLTLPNLPITNGKQITTGSCNPATMGTIPSTTNMPSAKFVFPPNFGTIKANTAFTITMAIQNLETGNFVNAEESYFSAPQQLNAQGQIIGHSHVVVEPLTSLSQTTPNDPTKFAFFKGLNNAAVNGQLTANVTSGLPAGVYKVSSINTAANHQPALVPIAQHGSLDDVVYFTVTADGNPLSGSSSASAASSSVVASSTVASSSAVSSASVAASTSAANATSSAKSKSPATAKSSNIASSTAISSVAAASATHAESSASESAAAKATSTAIETSASAKGKSAATETVSQASTAKATSTAVETSAFAKGNTAATETASSQTSTATAKGKTSGN